MRHQEGPESAHPSERTSRIESPAMRSRQVILATLTTVCVLGFALVIVYLRGRSKRNSQEERADRAKPSKFDTTLGDFHDMREALRPLQHTRTASRRTPASR